MSSPYAKAVLGILAQMQESREESGQQQPEHEYDVYVEDDRITFVKLSPGEETPSDGSPPRGERTRSSGTFVLSLLLLVSSLFIPSSQALPHIATITILATLHAFHTNVSITVPSDMVKQVSFTETGTAPATGHGHQNATFAHGYVTFYNSLLQPQTIDAGTLITANDGVQVATDQTAYVPAGTFAGNGQTTVSSHAINPGREGNMHAGDISGTCCREYILVRNNSAFTGGQNARDYIYVTASDMKDLQNTLLSKIDGELQKEAMPQAQEYIPATDTLVRPPPCSSTVQPNHRVGDEAASVTVTVSQSCTIVSYPQIFFQGALISEVVRQIEDQFGTGYLIAGNPTEHITSTNVHPSEITFLIASTALYGVDFRTLALSKLIAGKSRQEAVHILVRQKGIDTASIDMDNGMNTLPDGTTDIHILVIYKQS